MPIYEYRCSSCGFQKDHLLKVSDPLLSVCPECGKDSYKKMLTSAGFQLKGSGWYATDFKGNGSSKTVADGKNGGADNPAADKSGDKPASQPAAVPAAGAPAAAPVAAPSTGT